MSLMVPGRMDMQAEPWHEKTGRLATPGRAGG